MGGYLKDQPSGTIYISTLKLDDTNASNYLTFDWSEDDTSDRTLGIAVGGGNRVITLSGNPTLNDWFDQSVKVAGTPTFASLTIANTTSSTLGVIKNATINLISTYKHATADGNNVFVGGAGNFTLSPDGGASTLASYNTGIGVSALMSLTTGGYNSALGTQALYSNTTGSYNSAMGYLSLYYNTGGSNSALGSLSLYYNTTGYRNLALGYQAGYGETTANAPATDTYGILIGYNVNRSVVTATELTNYIGIGNGTLIDKSNQVKIGNASIVETNLFGAVVLAGTPDVVSAAGAISVTTPITHIVTNGVGTVLTLANGVEGQTKIILIKTFTATHTDVITPAGGGKGWTTATLSALGQSATLLYTDSKWVVTGSFGATIA